ncbi:MAG: DUF4160 domain-containing protein [Selenomonadaceae bacterium]|nr:DUF4160 domain-containing protein [Selenomonadaceae bacterium]
MPQTLEKFLGYIIYFWFEPKEPIHVHVCKGHPHEGATKIWITENGAELAHNNSGIPKKDLKKIMQYITSNKNRVIADWLFRNQSGELKR